MKTFTSFLSFAVPTRRVGGAATRPLLADTSTQSSIETDHVHGVASTSIHRFSSSSLAGIISGATAFVGQSIAATDEYEMAELPPIWVPAVFGVVLLIGVALLTSSLGNVMDEGKWWRKLIDQRSASSSS